MIAEGSELAEESKYELSQEQLQQLMIIVPEEGMMLKRYKPNTQSLTGKFTLKTQKSIRILSEYVITQ
ncbi:hypothetical protein Tco_0402695, partial [Tanacetum coccineum]